MQPDDDTPAGLEDIARKHGFTPGAARTMLASLMTGHGRQAQFDHPEFGGMGQWSGGGMLMIGAMFDTALKARVDGLIRDLTGLAQTAAQARRSSDADDGSGASAWPQELGVPSSSGSQNGMDYAVFPETRRLAVRQDGQLTVYDTGDHRIGGASQRQDGGRLMHFASQHGPVSLASLARVDLNDAERRQAGPPPRDPQSQDGTIPATIERLHDMLSRGILTQAEFDAKKADMLKRL